MTVPSACRVRQQKNGLLADTPAKQTVEVIIVITNI
ncbi:Vago-PB, isoform B [Serratia plymuthica]|nr:Vago-PB, isoform B [Serratia plymuthica]